MFSPRITPDQQSQNNELCIIPKRRARCHPVTNLLGPDRQPSPGSRLGLPVVQVRLLRQIKLPTQLSLTARTPDCSFQYSLSRSLKDLTLRMLLPAVCETGVARSDWGSHLHERNRPELVPRYLILKTMRDMNSYPDTATRRKTIAAFCLDMSRRPKQQ